MTRVARLRLGTRGSALARWQADWVAAQLRELGADVELVEITTQGDVRPGSLRNLGGQGAFTKEIQRALLDERVDLAVHSLKDLPTEPVEGLRLAAVPPRESPADVLVFPTGADWRELPSAARVGTGSVRRQAQIRSVRPDVQVLEIRGNVDTRLKKLDAGEYDAILLAEAGLRRLGWTQRISQVVPLDQMLPAAGQGALGLETRADDQATRAALDSLNDAPSWAAVTAERAVLATLQAGCLAPVGVWGRMVGQQLWVDAVVLSVDGVQRLTAQASGHPRDAESIGRDVAARLLILGAAPLIASQREAESAAPDA